ncbi:inositol 2-dehydrogenase [Dethiobacter alkaliphilus]|uniref:inositol 2-dehydrogenase n=1 Tax=Dethiobacter alkaliphilus TaxID=427926 RepID=UPI0022272882|nr:inositol 2-dehydrogenase [Dethiobacter alkaliphilus]MCW3490000.1 inositol 2-dehydrogenase [Dethiobacter alkaliphilus]
MSKKLKIGVIGTGRIGKLHTNNIVKNFTNVEIKAIADVYADQAKDWAASLGITEVYNDYKKIMNDPEIDAVLICSSTDTHSQFTIEAANAGKHVFCEKPIDLDVERIKATLDAVKKAGVKLQVGFNRRFDHNFKKIAEMVKDGKVGDVHIVKVTSRDPEPPPVEYIKVSGGIFLDMTIHDFDMACYLSGSEVVEVYANAGVMIDPAIGEAGDVDTAIVTLKFANGAIGVIDNSRKAAYGYDQRVEVFGTKGCLEAKNDTPTNVVYSNEESVSTDKPKYFFLERYTGSFIEEMGLFFDSIINDTEPPVSGIDGLNAVLVGMAAKKSYEEKRPVKL